MLPHRYAYNFELQNLGEATESSGISPNLYLEAAKFGYTVGKEGIGAIWKITNMDHKPYVYAFNFDGHMPLNKPWCKNLQEDKICITKKPKTTTYKDKVKITLHNHDDWWKALTVHNAKNEFLHEDLWNQDANHSDTSLLDYKEMLTDFMVLSKAKAGGAHTNMYWI